MAKIEVCAVFYVEREEILVLRAVEKKVSIFWKFGKFSNKVNNKVTQFNQIIADYVSEKNFDNLVLVATVSKEITNFNPKDGLHLNKLGVRCLSAILLKSLYQTTKSVYNLLLEYEVLLCCM